MIFVVIDVVNFFVGMVVVINAVKFLLLVRSLVVIYIFNIVELVIIYSLANTLAAITIIITTITITADHSA